MASFSNRAGGSKSAQDSRPLPSSAGAKSAVRLIAQSTLSVITRLTGKLRTWRQRARERAELARMSQTELRDIGVSSSDRWEEINKPFWRK
jgi:uncharacterized protein YjiS (DUF1127 family)